MLVANKFIPLKNNFSLLIPVLRKHKNLTNFKNGVKSKAHTINIHFNQIILLI